MDEYLYFVMEKEYSGESIVDLEEDIMYNIENADVPKDEHGVHKGTFRVTVQWIEDEDGSQDND